MVRYLLRTLRARLRAGRMLDVLTVLGVALGVGAVLSIQILNRNALGAFRGSVRAVSGEADLTVRGATPSLPEAFLVEVLAQPGVAGAWPLVRADVAVAGRDDLRLDILGFDLFAPVTLPFQDVGDDLTGALATPGWVAVTPQLAGREGWSVGSEVAVAWGDRTGRLQVGALVDFQRITPLASSRLAVMDIAQAQSLLGRRGRIHQIDVRVDEGRDPAVVAAGLQDRLGDAVVVASPEQREQEAARFLGPFRLNLTALSLISLFVGVFLVQQSVQASLARRRQELGLLRSLGATRRQVIGLVLTDVAGLAVLGVGLGLVLGYGAARAGLDGVSATVANLYLLEEMETLVLPPWIVVLAAAVGLGGALAGALGPALDLSRRDAGALLAAYRVHERLSPAAPRLFAAGALILGASGAWYVVAGRGWRPAGFVLALALLAALPLMTPLTLRAVTGLGRPHGFGLGYSLRSLGLRLRVTALAVAALAVAVSMLVGVTFMIASFRTTVDRWIGATVQADVYVASRSLRRGDHAATLSSGLVDELAGWPGVRGADRLRRMDLRAGGAPMTLIGVDMALPGGEVRFPVRRGDAADAQRQAREEGAVLLGEPLARSLGLGPGDVLSLPAPGGRADLPVAAVYHDYSAGAGVAAVDLATLERLYGPGPVHGVALYLEPGADAEAKVSELQTAFADVPLRIRSNRTLREDVLRVFDQTFAVTRILQGMGLLIAVCGITLTLLVLARQQVSELALYRALGARRRQIFRFYLGKGVGMAALGIALGAVSGVALAWTLTFVINPDYFGWTLEFHWPWRSLAGQAATILAAVTAASIYPALRASRTPATELSREEVA